MTNSGTTKTEYINLQSHTPTKEAGFTPGEWTWIKTHGQFVIESPRETVAHVDTLNEADAHLMSASKELYEALQAAEPLLMQLCSVALRKEVADYLPHGLLERVNDWLANSTAQEALSKAVPR